MQRSVIVWENLPQYKGVDLYLSNDGCTASIEEATKFISFNEAGRALNRVEKVIDKFHSEAKVVDVWSGGWLR